MPDLESLREQLNRDLEDAKARVYRIDGMLQLLDHLEAEKAAKPSEEATDGDA